MADNGSEYKNSLLEEFCIKKHLKHIYTHIFLFFTLSKIELILTI